MHIPNFDGIENAITFLETDNLQRPIVVAALIKLLNDKLKAVKETSV